MCRFARCSLPVIVLLFWAFCTSIKMYSQKARCTQRSYSALRAQFNNEFRMLVGFPRFCSASGMFADAHVDFIYTKIRNRFPGTQGVGQHKQYHKHNCESPGLCLCGSLLCNYWWIVAAAIGCLIEKQSKYIFFKCFIAIKLVLPRKEKHYH